MSISSTTPSVIIFTGAPGSGKTTLRDAIIQPGQVVLSTDDLYMEMYSQGGRLTYNEAFAVGDYKDVLAEFMIQMKKAVMEGKDIIIDQMNESVRKRSKHMQNVRAIRDDYRFVSIDFDVDKETVYERNRSRGPGREIPGFVLDNYYKYYERPSKNEGFSKLWVVYADGIPHKL